MNPYIWTLGIMFLLFSAGCAHIDPKQSPSKQISLSLLDQLAPGLSTKEDVNKLLGRPQEITRSKDKGELWEYNEKELNRVTLSFGTDNVLEAWAFSVFDWDRETKLKNALDVFPNAAWQVENPKWINPHSWPDECYFQDNKQGIAIEYRQTRKEVSMIRRWSPARVLATDEEEKPPTYCIDSFCGPALNYKKEFGNKPICNMPK
ncbi:MAG: hypothetical protein HY537_00595 [Deltaproteobacteria bacterium]|nr:hypothetical protein [Deltaproteobacteria bacterium]